MQMNTLGVPPENQLQGRNLEQEVDDEIVYVTVRSCLLVSTSVVDGSKRLVVKCKNNY